MMRFGSRSAFAPTCRQTYSGAAPLNYGRRFGKADLTFFDAAMHPLAAVGQRGAMAFKV